MGTCQVVNASGHVNTKLADVKRDFDTLEIVLDEAVRSREDVLALGIGVGDYVCFDPRTAVTESGYIKSRFIDDKLSVALLLGFAKRLRRAALRLRARCLRLLRPMKRSAMEQAQAFHARPRRSSRSIWAALEKG